jgi:CYTH domain-containing protein
VRGEYEEQITVQQFEELRSTYEDSACDYVNKIRYKFQYGSFIIELDVYLRNLKGLVILEVELPDAEALKNFVPPPGFDLVDVTSDARYSNRMLAQHGIPK